MGICWCSHECPSQASPHQQRGPESGTGKTSSYCIPVASGPAAVAAVEGRQGHWGESRLLQISFYTQNSTCKIQTRVPQHNFYSARGISLSLPLSQSHLSHPAGSTQSIAVDLTAPGSPPFPALTHTAVSQQLHPGASSDSKSTASTLLHAHSTSPSFIPESCLASAMRWPAAGSQAPRTGEGYRYNQRQVCLLEHPSTRSCALPTVQIPVIQHHYSPGGRKPAGSKGGPTWQTTACPVPFCTKKQGAGKNLLPYGVQLGNHDTSCAYSQSLGLMERFHPKPGRITT